MAPLDAKLQGPQVKRGNIRPDNELIAAGEDTAQNIIAAGATHANSNLDDVPKDTFLFRLVVLARLRNVQLTDRQRDTLEEHLRRGSNAKLLVIMCEKCALYLGCNCRLRSSRARRPRLDTDPRQALRVTAPLVAPSVGAAVPLAMPASPC
jgi:hypothetical protein